MTNTQSVPALALRMFLPLTVLAATLDAQPARGQVQLLVQRASEITDIEARALLASHGADEDASIPQIRTHVIRVPEEAAERVQRALLRSGKFEVVEADGVATAEAMPNDTYIPSSWHLYKIDAPGAWLTTAGSSAVTIAVLDSGVDGLHPDLKANMVAGYNFVASNTNTSDVQGHGTKVAGAAAAVGNNLMGVAGIAFRSRIMPLVVMNSSGYAMYSNMAKAMIHAADRGVRVINISISGATSSSTLQNAVNYAWNRGAVVFAAAGNSNTSAATYPAACANVIAVGATDSNDVRASYSNYGSWIDITAPGNGIYTTLRGGTYGTASGTSLATPVAAGVAALMVAVNPALTATQLSTRIRSSARDLGTAGFDNIYGAGRVDANRAVLSAR